MKTVNENIEELQKVISLHERLGDSIDYYVDDNEIIKRLYKQ